MAVAVVVALASASSVAAAAQQAAAPNNQATAKKPAVKRPARRRAAKQRIKSDCPPIALKKLNVADCKQRIRDILTASPNELPKYEGEPEKRINGGLLWQYNRNECLATCDPLDPIPDEYVRNKYTLIEEKQKNRVPYIIKLAPYVIGKDLVLVLPERTAWAGLGQAWRVNKADAVRDWLERLP
jgi:hypothetical protein